VSFHVACAQQQSSAPLITQDCHTPLHVLKNRAMFSLYILFFCYTAFWVGANRNQCFGSHL